MRKLLTLALAVLVIGLALPIPAQSAPCNADVVVHGTVHFLGVSGGCWQFQGDDGNNYELFTNKRNILRDGLTGTLYGKFPPGPVATVCQVGIPVEVCRFFADQAQAAVGKVTFDPCLEGGCWRFTVGSKSYQPISQDPSFFQHNAIVWAQFVERPDLVSFCQIGPIIEILDFEVLRPGEETPTCGGGIISLSSSTADCEDRCPLRACTLECAQLPAAEQAPNFLQCFNACIFSAAHCIEACENHP